MFASAATGYRSRTRRWTAASSSTSPTGARASAPSRCTASCSRRPGGRRPSAACGCTRPNATATPARFEFMNSEVSSEKPKALLVRQVADRMRAARDRGGRVLAVCGPAVIHTGGGPALARLVRDGWIDVLFAGNGFATHDMESNVHGTSLGVSVTSGHGTEGGHSNHLRLINEIRRHGSIAAAVEAGLRHRRRDVRVRAARRAVRARRLGPRRRAAARHHRRRRRGGRRHARPRARRDGRAHAGVDAARHRHRQHPPRRGRDVLRRHQPGRRHQARRPWQPPGPRHRHRRRPVPPRPRRGAGGAA